MEIDFIIVIGLFTFGALIGIERNLNSINKNKIKLIETLNKKE